MKNDHLSNETEMNEIDHDLERFHDLRRQYDPFFMMSDDYREYLRYFSMHRELTYMKNDLGLFGQDLTVPVYNPKTYTLEYV